MKTLALKTTWLKGDLDDLNETATFAALGITVDGDSLTRVYDHRAGGDRDTIQVPVYPLALVLRRTGGRCFMSRANLNTIHILMYDIVWIST